MGVYADRVLPRVIDIAMRGGQFTEIRHRVAAGLEGRVVEVGFGSGLNVPHYPPGVSELLAVDPSGVAWKRAAERIAASSVPIEYVALDGQHLPLDAASVDHVLSTWTLCTIPDLDRALTEMNRVLRPGGTLRFVEHGLSLDPSVARWQARLTPIQRRLAGGCHLNRPLDEHVRRSGLELVRLTNYYMRGPKAFGYTYEGVAAKR
jgi:ubiquinone/menaquinone biosynthesis C-methylase UbiE